MNDKLVLNLISKLDTASDKDAEKVIQKLALIGEPAVPQLLLAASDQSRPRIRKWSLQALGEIAVESGVPPIISALSDSRMTVKLHAILAIKRMAYKPAEKKLVKLLKDKSGGIRVNAIDALIAIEANQSGSDLIKCLSDESWYVRQHAARACGKLKIKRSKKHLEILVNKDNKKAVREAAVEALAQF